MDRVLALFMVLALSAGCATTFDGGIYEGKFEDGKPNGQGTLTFRNGAKYVGEFKRGMWNGQGTLTFHNGTKYIGEFKDGKYNGRGTYTCPDGTVYTGDFEDDKLHSQGMMTCPDGKKYVGEFKDNMPNGQGTMTKPDGTTQTGLWKTGWFSGGALLDGYEAQTNANKETEYVGEWKDGLPNGQGTMTYHKHGMKYVGEFNDGMRNGRGTMTKSDGTATCGLWKDNRYLGPSAIRAEFISTPPGAVVALDGLVLGTTPFTAEVPQKSRYTGPTTMNFNSKTFEEGYRRIKESERQANYVFTATLEGHQEARMVFFVNDGLPSVVRFELKSKTP